ncbi:hypothetical protein B0H11DRAFT_2070172 [Mycena galericulata]|nr:hypothetical protein B0H11DRAFT_2070172 [Mycena galericulata]
MARQAKIESALGPATQTPIAIDRERTALADYRVRIAVVKSQILELENSLRPLQEEETLLQDRLDAYKYPVLTLPNEIVSEIFIHFLPPYPKCPPIIGLRSPRLLSLICRKWREIAFSTPALWRAVGLSLRKKERFVQQLRLLEQSLGRSGSSPLSIKLQYRASDGSPSSVLDLDQFLQTIVSHSSHCEHLYIPVELLPSLRSPAPVLRSLILGGTFGVEVQELQLPSSVPTFFSGPLLHKVTLRLYTPAFYPVLPWSQLTVLFVHWISTGDCARVLRQAINLVYCQLWIFHVEAEELSDITLLQLETLRLRMSLGSETRFMNALTLPALRSLQLQEHFIQPNPVSTLVSLVTRSRCTLQELFILGSSVSRELYQAAIPSLVSVIYYQEMVLDNWDSEDDEFVDDHTDTDSELGISEPLNSDEAGYGSSD